MLRQSINSETLMTGRQVRDLSQKSEVTRAWISLELVEMKRIDPRDVLKEKVDRFCWEKKNMEVGEKSRKSETKEIGVDVNVSEWDKKVEKGRGSLGR